MLSPYHEHKNHPVVRDNRGLTVTVGDLVNTYKEPTLFGKIFQWIKYQIQGRSLLSDAKVKEIIIQQAAKIEEIKPLLAEMIRSDHRFLLKKEFSIMKEGLSGNMTFDYEQLTKIQRRFEAELHLMNTISLLNNNKQQV